MSDTVPIFEEFNNKKTKNNDIDYIEPRVKVTTKLWKIFKFVAATQEKRVPDAISEAIELWINNINNLNTVYKCECGKNIDIENNYYHKRKDGIDLYYCSMKCLVEYYKK